MDKKLVDLGFSVTYFAVFKQALEVLEVLAYLSGFCLQFPFPTTSL